jgi:DNA-binding NarL/FixJ family response regulator
VSDIERLRAAARELSAQDGRGLPLRTLVDLAEVCVPRRVTLYPGDPAVVVLDASGSSSRFRALSAREREIAALLAGGLTNRQIAESLVLSVATVKDHVHSILCKTGLPTRAAVAGAWRA